jgi:hypothetical protein
MLIQGVMMGQKQPIMQSVFIQLCRWSLHHSACSNKAFPVMYRSAA